MIKKYLAVYTVLLLVFVFCIGTNSFAQESKRRTIGSSRFERKMQKTKVVVIDVRTAEEYDSGYIEDAINLDMNLPDFVEKINELDRSCTYLLYCRSGKRSARAMELMRTNGFENTWHLRAGILKWKGKIEINK